MSRSAIIIGGGAAGLSAALGLLSEGFRVEVLEQQPEWKGRVCGAFLNPDAVRNLASLGLLEKAQELGAPVPVAHLHGAKGADATVFTAQDGTTGMALSRRELEDLLRAAIQERGGAIVAGARATAYTRAGTGWTVTSRGASADASHTADVLVLADGRFSMAADEAKPDPGWYGWNASFSGIPQSPGTLNLYFSSDGYVGTLSFPDGATNVCGLVHRRKGDGVAWADVFTNFRRRNRSFDCLMQNATPLSEWRGVGPLPYTRTPRRVADVILAGDAAGVGDPFMGEGIGRALGTGPLIQAALRQAPEIADFPATYASLWESFYGARFQLGWKARLLLDRPWLAFLFVDCLLRPRLIERAAEVFHRGAGFPTASLPTEASKL